MSARSPIVGPSPRPWIVPTTPCPPTPVATSMPQPASCSATRAAVRGVSRPNSGCACRSRRIPVSASWWGAMASRLDMTVSVARVWCGWCVEVVCDASVAWGEPPDGRLRRGWSLQGPEAIRIGGRRRRVAAAPSCLARIIGGETRDCGFADVAVGRDQGCQFGGTASAAAMDHTSTPATSTRRPAECSVLDATDGERGRMASGVFLGRAGRAIAWTFWGWQRGGVLEACSRQFGWRRFFPVFVTKGVDRAACRA